MMCVERDSEEWKCVEDCKNELTLCTRKVGAKGEEAMEKCMTGIFENQQASDNCMKCVMEDHEDNQNPCMQQCKPEGELCAQRAKRNGQDPKNEEVMGMCFEALMRRNQVNKDCMMCIEKEHGGADDGCATMDAKACRAHDSG